MNEFRKTIKLTFELSKTDLKNRYIGSILGILWGFIQPLITILIFWFVFQVGFKSIPVDDFPFILWLMCAMIPWFFLSDSLSGATNSIIENSYLVKKMNFKVGILPVVKILSSFYIHIFFIIFLFLMFYIYDYDFNIYNLQVIYYLIASILLLLGFSYLTSSLVIFLKDIGHFVNMILQFCFWITPIFWSIDILPEKYLFLIKLNPVYYITEGYRYSFIYHQWFWEKPNLTLYFWVFTILNLALGYFVYRKLRSHFADVL
ncbi:ABC transporter permease [Psychrobacillus sp. FJAT-51614]|uniref:Transport permease protein n=1 Tax=Psychrobacillus mangrovi TaxID=3117745 RepID=A0ABU8F1F6_9BACI